MPSKTSAANLSDYTLTVVLNFIDGSTVAIASNAKDWFPAQGTFEVMP